MRILIYGFGVYGSFKKNVTEKIVRRLPRRRQLTKMIFPVRFHRRQFIDAVKKHDPEVVLGLGQCSGGRRLRNERLAVNKRRDDRYKRTKPIVRRGPRQLPTSLRLNLAPPARFSRNAGDYVCNYSMYVILDYLKRRRLPIRYGFIHIPHDYDPSKAMGILVNAIDKIAASRSEDSSPDRLDLLASLPFRRGTKR